jgi:hypothetical protein
MLIKPIDYYNLCKAYDARFAYMRVSEDVQQVKVAFKGEDFDTIYECRGGKIVTKEGYEVSEDIMMIVQFAVLEYLKVCNQKRQQLSDWTYVELMDNSKRVPYMLTDSIILKKLAQEVKALERLQASCNAHLQAAILAVEGNDAQVYRDAEMESFTNFMSDIILQAGKIKSKLRHKL